MFRSPSSLLVCKKYNPLMVDTFELIILTNQIMSILAIFPLLLNLKYYLQIKIRDYLYVSLFFLFYFLTIFLSRFFKLSYTFFYIANFIAITIAIRTKWENPPIWARGFAGFYFIFAFFNLLIPTETSIGNYWIGQYFFNPLNLIAVGFILYCYITTSVVVSENSKAHISRYLWIAFFVLYGFQDVLFYFFAVLPNLSPESFPLSLVFALQLNALVTNLIIFTLHLLFPEAVLFSYEQLVRAKQLYRKVDEMDNIVLDLGIKTINNYIEVAFQKISNE